MKNFVDALAERIIEQERPTLEKILGEVAINIQQDVVNVTYALIDAYYHDYTREEGRIYIRTDELPKHKQGRNGRFINKTGTANKRSGDVSLQTALKAKSQSKMDKKLQALASGDQPAIGVCEIAGDLHYRAGVVFDESKLTKKSQRGQGMQHSVMGPNFTEWDIIMNFLWGVHGADDVYVTTPTAGMELDRYIYSYQSRFKKHYNAAYNKYKNK